MVLRLLMVTFDPPENVGGIEGRVGGLVEELPGIGVPVFVVALSRAYSFKAGIPPGAHYLRGSSRPIGVLNSLSAIRGLIASETIDSVFLLSGAITILGNLLLLEARIRRKNSAVLFYGKDLLQARKHPVSRLLLFSSLLLSKRVLVNSKFTASLLPQFARARATVLYPGVNPALSLLPPRAEDPTRRVLFVGRLVKRKGVDDLIAAFSKVSVENPNSVLEIVGDGPERKNLEKLATNLDLGSRITFYGTLRGEPLYDRYGACEMVVMSSKQTEEDVEGFGTIFLEASLFAKPAVGTRSGGIPEAIVDGVTGILVGESNVAELASAINRLLSDKALRDQLGRNAKTRALQSFTWQDSALNLVRAFHDEP